MSSLIAFGAVRERYLACRPLAEDPGPDATVRALAEIWMVTCEGRLERARRILLRRDWESLDDEIVGAMPASLTTARYRVVAGVGIAQPVTAPNHAGRIALSESPGSAQHLYILGRARRVIEHYAAEAGAWRIKARYSLHGYLPPDRAVWGGAEGAVCRRAAVRVAVRWAVVLDPECYARHYRVELEQVRGWLIETVCCAVCDIPGLSTLGAATRWHGPKTRPLAPSRPAPVPRTRSMRVRFAVTVEVGAQAWARWAQVPLEHAAIDLRAYLCEEVPALPCLANYGAVLHWHTPVRPARYGRTWWPSGREGYDDIPDPGALIPKLAEIEGRDWA